ncbi:Ig-like domain (group 3) [Actinopolymorpha cephalotaxi]|uniref:Ig-like domain (Group 3) n=1 Tax=Actinopolymorpha cephalotaxi TaxID=504797 RepID=A0A1I2T8W9_9ACTN|nr:DUF4082 domain-containing protein [Actinopolymorpha cephalotaxi]NYH82979.1 hypothetical protein [Actinopolymorpha cephalotaxi]SFG61423.1 Ig-like domain (group 3) [Actinopolymorpha cephalotaxi]
MVLATILGAGWIAATPSPASAAPVDLGNAKSFAVLAGTSVNSTNLSIVTGDLGVSPGNTVVGFPPGQVVNGTIHAGDAVAAAARTDLLAASGALTAQGPATSVASELGGTTRRPGVYTTSGSIFTITGTLTLDAQADPDATFIFQAQNLATADVSNINLINGAQANNVFFQLTASAILGAQSTFYGNVLAQSRVTVSSGAAVYGRVFALTDYVIFQGTTNLLGTRVTLPNDPQTTTTLDVSPNPATSGQQVTFTATVRAVDRTVIPQGEVAFREGDTILGRDFVDSSGVAVFTTSNLPPARHRLTAVYLGGNTFAGEEFIHFAPSASPDVTEVVQVSLFTGLPAPSVESYPDPRAVTVGVKFFSATGGKVAGIRFYKGALNTGTHTVSLWTTDGRLLASSVSSNETGSGWQQADFSSPVAISANTTYLASYHTTSGFYSVNRPYFTVPQRNGPLTAPADGGAQGGNGVYAYGATNTFPTNTFQASNYWVDVAFVPSSTLWQNTTVPATPSHPDANAVTVGVKFFSASAGTVTGIRFYKGALNTGTHTVSLWTASGQLLASAVSSNETASGWQQADFSSPVAISADTTYVASYHTTSGFYSVNRPYFTIDFVSPPLTAPVDGGVRGGNGVYRYGSANSFPTSTYQSSNYWVDVAFELG